MRQKLSSLIFFMFVSITILYPYHLLAANESGQVAYIDTQRIVDESKAGKGALKDLEEFKKKNEEELAKKAKEITDMEEESRKKKMALSAEALENLEESVRKKNIELKRFKEDKELEWKELYFKHLTKIKEEILQIVQELGKEKNYTIVFNKDDSVLYANPSFDITNQIIEIYDQKGKK